MTMNFSLELDRAGAGDVRYLPRNGGIMADLIEILKQLPPAITAAAAYAAGTHGFFHYLDTQASAKAKKAISGWFKPLEYDKVAVAAATVEIFDRLYTRPLLSWRAGLRSAFITTVVTVIFAYEFSTSLMFMFFQGFTMARYHVLIFWMILLLTNIASDYISLFIVRRFLVFGGARPIVALIVGPLLGMFVVVLFTLVRSVGVMEDTIWAGIDLFQPDFNSTIIIGAFSVVGSLPAFAVHLWLPLFVFGLLCVNGLNYTMWAIGGMQWFLKRGNEHPLDAVGYVLGAIVFVGAAAARLFG
jgi:hypothetical protein